MGMFGKKDGKFVTLLVQSAMVSLAAVGAGGTSLVGWPVGSEHAGMSPKITK